MTGGRVIRRWGSLALLAAASAAAAGGAGAGPAVASSGKLNGRLLGGVPSTVRLHLTVVLKPEHPEALASFARAVSDPSSPEYRGYLTPQQVGERFGASRTELDAVAGYLRAHGLAPGPVAPDRLAIPVTASAGRVEQAFRLRLERRALAHGREATVASATPALPAPIARGVQSVLGLTSLSAPHPLLERPTLLPSLRSALGARLSPHVVTGGAQPCSAAGSRAQQDHAYTADQIASGYGLSGLYGAGDQGEGVTIALYELEDYSDSDIAGYQACYGTHAPVTRRIVAPGPGTAAPGSGEAALDIENAIGLAPKASYIVYEGQNANQTTPGSGPFDTFSAIVNDDRANVISVSWGECEQLQDANGSRGAQAESTLFEQAAAQGQTIVSAAGDAGSEDCNGASPVPDTELAVDDPASQPFVTGVGGTSTSQIGPPTVQSVWNNAGNPTALVPGLQPGATGGGVSALWGMQGYQTSAAGSLHVINGDSSGSQCGNSSGFCREVPDVSANADPNSGYVIYYAGSWQTVGGTSAAAPVWAAVLALIDGSSGCHGSDVGFANPALYAAAGSGYSSYFADVTAGNNDFTGTNGGRYPAGAAYDMATGLGTPNAAALAAPLCADALRLVNPGPRSAVVGQSVGLQLRTSGRVAAKPIYVASGLPPGLVIGRFTGRISGKPTRIGTYHVAVVIVDGDLSVRGTTFQWKIGGRPTVTSASLTGVGGGRPTLQMTVRAGRLAPGLDGLVLYPPSGLRFASARLVVRGPHGTRVHFRARLRGGRLTLSLSGGPRIVLLRTAFPSLTSSGALSARIRRRAARLSLKLRSTDAGGHRVTFAVGIPTR